MEKLMTLEEVAKYLRLSIHTLYKMAEQKRIPALKAGKQWRKKKLINGWKNTGELIIRNETGEYHV